MDPVNLPLRFLHSPGSANTTNGAYNVLSQPITNPHDTDVVAFVQPRVRVTAADLGGPVAVEVITQVFADTGELLGRAGTQGMLVRNGDWWSADPTLLVSVPPGPVIVRATVVKRNPTIGELSSPAGETIGGVPSRDYTQVMFL